MQAALAQARRGLGRIGNARPSVGCVLVKGGRIIAAARTGDFGAPHAEVAALIKAGSDAEGAAAYVTLEPCAHHGKTPPCAGALIAAGIARCVIACIDPFAPVNGEGARQLEMAGVQVDVGVLEQEAQDVNRGFFLSVLEKRPMVTLKCATTADGKITLGESKKGWVTGDLARRHAHLERSMHDAILVGIGTVLADDPLLTARLAGVDHRGPRIVLDTNLRIPLGSKLVKTAQDVPLWVFYRQDKEGKAAALEPTGVRLFQYDGDLSVLLKILAEQGITRLLVEGGAAVMTAFLQAGFYDRILWYKAPMTAAGGKPALNGLDIADMPAHFGLERQESRALGKDLLEIYGPKA